MKKIFSLVVAILLGITLVACTEDKKVDDVQTINVAINNKKETILYKQADSYVGPDNVTYTYGQLKPVWAEVQKKLNVKLVDKASDNDDDSSPMFKRLSELSKPFDGVDVLTGNSADFINTGPKNLIVPLSDHLAKMPNLARYLDENPNIEKQLKAADGKIYHTPYVDSYGDIVSNFMMRLDWVEKLLDDELPAVGKDTAILQSTFTPTLPEALNTKILVPKADGAGTTEVTKNYTQNILTVQNNLSNKTGLELLKALRNHIDSTYGDTYAKRSDLFISSQAAYDADELIALMRVVKYNPKFLTNDRTENITVFTPRTGKGTDHRLVARIAQIWGVRGVESSFQWTWADIEGKLHDARVEDEMYVAFERLHAMYKEGLIQEDYDKGYNNDLNSEWRKELLTRGNMFMSYDIPSTSSGFAKGDELTGRYETVLPPAVKWNTGETNEYEYFHFTESINNLKTGGWGIPAKAFNDSSQEKRDKIFELMDYFFSQEGSDLISFGPEAWRDGKFIYTDGKEYVKLSDKTIADMQNNNLRSSGNWSNYMRMYVGATFTVGHSRPGALAYQNLTEQGKSGVNRLGLAIKAGTYKIATFDKVDNPWYMALPSSFPISPDEDAFMKEHQALVLKTQFGSNIQPKWTLLIKYGWGDPKTSEWGTKKDISDARKEFEDYWLTVYQKYYTEFFGN
ncbi:carbohydrate ABC transporter subunit, extracellular solute-binding protein [Alteracholeplasma palmae J233]|uniref:Carbohydrate ABC transporter subunit, extracellular solute-binding protein n=1 Tax=Alteracholeplasma palmae (strain ATCC 49389 / J233) TaxID=1318466 RepID=U4KPM4_ALTPJ|nr:carbohydrate ABC transporter subunit, extracellular solute-binding protein [Alteracholeplasma palmae]CCV64215.1 carbohydrate ABC transporter subunit, extracellular solute-binding protein [Alteracholeplasma palmae J233]